MRSQILKMIADWRFGDKPKETRDYEDIDPTERDNNSWWYLHGKLQSLVGFDKAIVTNCKSGKFAKETIYWTEIVGNRVINVASEYPHYQMHFNGEVDVEIEGIDKLCKGFFYVTNEHNIYYKDQEYLYWEQRGLVCFADDIEACKYARKKMNQKSQIL